MVSNVEVHIFCLNAASRLRTSEYFSLIGTHPSSLNSLQPSIFEDIAQEAVDLCRTSLSSAANLIATKDSSMRLDSQLFLIRHLLVLKELANNLNLGLKSNDGPLELRHVAGSLMSLFYCFGYHCLPWYIRDTYWHIANIEVHAICTRQFLCTYPWWDWDQGGWFCVCLNQVVTSYLIRLSFHLEYWRWPQTSMRNRDRALFFDRGPSPSCIHGNSCCFPRHHILQGEGTKSRYVIGWGSFHHWRRVLSVVGKRNSSACFPPHTVPWR